MNITTADRFRSVVFHSECQQRLYTVACSQYNRCQPQVIPHILQNTFRAIVHRTVHRPLCHEYLTPDRTTFSGLSSFYTVLWHITLKAICKKQYSSRASNTPPPGQPKFSFSKSPCPVKRSFLRTNSYSCRFCPAIQVFPRANLCPIAKPNRRSQNSQKRLEYTNAMGASYLILLR